MDPNLQFFVSFVKLTLNMNVCNDNEDMNIIICIWIYRLIDENECMCICMYVAVCM